MDHGHTGNDSDAKNDAHPADRSGARSRTSTWRRIGRSWLALKGWVRAWLFFLNFVLLGSLFFLSDPAGRWILLAYLAAGPLLLGIMHRQRGLTRVLGIAHLVPWTPLTVYLALRLTTARLGPQITAAETPLLFAYVLLVLVTVGVCLAFDAYDLARWIRGERYVMGSEEAYEAGASRLAPGGLDAGTSVQRHEQVVE